MRSNELSSQSVTLKPTNTIDKTKYNIQNRVYKNPTGVDVLFGRGGRSNNHEGNATYRGIVSKLEDKYKLCSNRTEKNVVIEEVIRKIESRGGNFLKKDKKLGWFVEDKSIVHQKVNQALRDDKDPEKRRLKRLRYLAKRNQQR